jgi:hypothetical protein
MSSYSIQTPYDGNESVFDYHSQDFNTSMSKRLSSPDGNVMLELRPLSDDALITVYEWNHGREQGWDLGEWLRQVHRPNWTHYSVHRGDIAVGCVSLELRERATVSYHLAFRPHTASLKELRISITACSGWKPAFPMRTARRAFWQSHAAFL